MTPAGARPVPPTSGQGPSARRDDLHRFLDGPRRLHITVNRASVQPWGPLHDKGVRHTGTAGRACRAAGGQRIVVAITSFRTGPNSRRRHKEEGAGLKGWNGQQGFYVYRNNRILVTISLARPTGCRSTASARVALDITNASDEAWQIRRQEVNGATARLPDSS